MGQQSCMRFTANRTQAEQAIQIESTTVMTSRHAAMQARAHFTGLVVRQLDRGLLVRIALARQFFAMD